MSSGTTGPTIGEIDLHLINEGRHEQLWQALGAHVRLSPSGGVTFRVWAPRRTGGAGPRRLQQLGRQPQPARPGRRLRGVGDPSSPASARASRYKFHIRGADGSLARQGRPDGLPHRDPPGHGVEGVREPARVARRRVDGDARAVAPRPAADVDLRGAPRARGGATPAPGRTPTTTWWSTWCPTSSRWASPTWSSCP